MKNKFKAEVLYESKGKTPAGHPFLTVKQARGYYQYAERGGQDSIFFILFDNDTRKFALIYESKPPMDEREQKLVYMTTAFGGSIDMEETTTYQEICQTEVREESGYVVPLDKIKSIGKTLVSTQMSQMAEGFLVDVTGIKKTVQAEYELTPDEEQKAKDENEFKLNKVVWMDIDELMENDDWKSIYVWTKAVYKNFITA